MNTDEVNRIGRKIIGPTFKGTFSAHHPTLRKLFLNTRKSRFCVILNTDSAKYKGQHWIAIYVDRPRKKCYVFDSYGHSPKFFHRDWEYLTKHLDSSVWHNKKRVQFAEDTCGLHCLYFLHFAVYSKLKPSRVVNTMSDDSVVDWFGKNNIFSLK